MGPSSRPQYKLDLGQLPPLVPNQGLSRTSSTTSSPTEQLPERNSRFAGAFGGMAATSSGRLGSSSPSHEHGGRLYPRRAREIQQSEGLGWGPPVASGLSTPLRETIPESPSDDNFPDFNGPSLDLPSLSRHSSLRGRRARAGTTPSRFPGLADAQTTSGQQVRTTLSSRVTPSGSPHRPVTASTAEGDAHNNLASASTLSRLRAGSTPNRSSLGLSPFGPSIWSNPTSRPRSSTLGSHASDDSREVPSSDPLYETDVKTLSFLGLDASGGSAQSADYSRFPGSRRPMLSDVNRYPSNRFRSYSTNAKEKYALEEEAAMNGSHYSSGTLTPSAHATAVALAATQAQIHQHNLEVQAFVNQQASSQSTSNRPRARTAGLLDASSFRSWNPPVQVGQILNKGFDQSLSAFDWSTDESLDYDSLTRAVQALQLQAPTAGLDLIRRDDQSRALWLGGLPSSTTQSTLKSLFQQFGKIESARVMTQKGYGFVNFESVSSAIRAKAYADGQELFAGQGPVRVGFAKDPSSSGTPGNAEVTLADGVGANGQLDATSNVHLQSSRSAATGPAINETQPTDLPDLHEIRGEMITIARSFGATQEEQSKIAAMIDQAEKYTGYAPDIPAIPEPSQIRMHDAPRLREIRKRIDGGVCSASEIEEIAQGMLPEVVELSSDYLGNTVVQKLFECCSDPIKEAMLSEIAPHLAGIGTHKNGTWAAQTIIRVAHTVAQQELIVQGLRPYGLALFLDQYGNYVMQGCLKFGSPMNNFLFECMLSQLWTLAEARFGARAMRACLESQEASRDHQRMLAAAIVLYSSHLATNSNGALLLTWYLDTCAFKNRRKILAPHLIPNLTQLCTHKVAYMTVLKLINQKEEPDARHEVLQALFFSQNDEVLESVLQDQVCGATFVFKTLTTPFFDEHLRGDAVDNVRRVLGQIKAQPNQNYKRLMDEVGVTRGGSVPERANSSTMSGPSPKKSRSAHQHMNGGASVYPPMQSHQPYTPAVPNGNMMHNGNFEAFNANGMNGTSYATNTLPSPMTPQHYHQQSPYSQGRYGYGAPLMNTSGYPGSMSGTYGQHGRCPQTHLAPNANSMMPQSGYSPMVGMAPGASWQHYGAPPPYMMPPQPMHPQSMMGGGGGAGGGGRRGRR